ncbi:hypothetical protein X975_24030, partial [Stegodyphus mimosarum]
MLNHFLVRHLTDLPITANTFFKQDEATCHISQISNNMLQNIFPSYLISKNRHISWYLRLFGLSACDFSHFALKSEIFWCGPLHTI